MVTAFREGDVSYAKFRSDLTDVMNGINCGIFDGQLIGSVLSLTGDLLARLCAGSHVSDVDCGTGHALKRPTQG